MWLSHLALKPRKKKSPGNYGKVAKGDTLSVRAARWRRCRSSSSFLSSSLICSVRALSLLGEITTRHQAPGPDIHRFEKQRERETERAREGRRETLIRCKRRRKATQSSVSFLGSPVLCCDGGKRGLVSDIFPLDLGL